MPGVGQTVGVAAIDRSDVARGRLIVLCGLPGSGKTTVARELVDTVGAIRLCPDEWLTALQINLYDEAGRARVEALQQSLATDLLRAGCTVVYESGGWTQAERDALRDRARGVGAAVELRFLDVSLDVLWARISNRNNRLPVSTAAIARDDLLQWSQNLERPDLNEMSSYDGVV